MKKGFRCGVGVLLGALLLFSLSLSNSFAINISSTAFVNGDNIPTKYGCVAQGGTNVNPPLAITGVPGTTQFLALIVDDPDSTPANYVHWVMYWNDETDTTIAENSTPSTAVVGANGNFPSTNDYTGPCPPANHQYNFTIYALSSDPGLGDGFLRAALDIAMDGNIIEQAALTGWFPSGGVTPTPTPTPTSTPQAQIVLNGTSFSTGDSLQATFQLNSSITQAFTAFAVIILPDDSMLNALTLDTPLTPVATNVPGLTVADGPFTFPLINTTIPAGAPLGSYEVVVAFFDPTQPITSRADAFLEASGTFAVSQ